MGILQQYLSDDMPENYSPDPWDEDVTRIISKSPEYPLAVSGPAQERLKQYENSKPPLWRKIAAAAVGAGMGYLQTSGYSQGGPEDISRIGHQIIYPEEGRLAGLAQMEQDQQKRGIEAAKAKQDIETSAAQAAYYRTRAIEAPPAPKFQSAPPGSFVYNDQTGEGSIVGVKPANVHVVGKSLVDDTGKVLYTAPKDVELEITKYVDTSNRQHVAAQNKNDPTGNVLYDVVLRSPVRQPPQISAGLAVAKEDKETQAEALANNAKAQGGTVEQQAQWIQAQDAPADVKLVALQKLQSVTERGDARSRLLGQGGPFGQFMGGSPPPAPGRAPGGPQPAPGGNPNDPLKIR